MRRIAFFGGSFDPPHRGHLAVALAAADSFALDQVLFAPVGRQPLKTENGATPFAHRYAMTALATMSDGRFVPSLVDSPAEGDVHGIANHARPNYTVETLARVRSQLTEQATPFVLYTLLGADSWLDIGQWHRARELLTMCDWIVAARPGFTLNDAAKALPSQISAIRVQDERGSSLKLEHMDGTTSRVFFLPYLREDISASRLRVSLEEDLDDDWIPAPIHQYIRKTGLYRAIRPAVRS